MGVCIIVEERCVVWVVFCCLLFELLFGDAGPEDILQGCTCFLGGINVVLIEKLTVF